MKLVILCVLIFVYILIGLMGMFPHGYIASNGIENYFQDHWTQLLCFYAVFSLLLAWLFFGVVKARTKTQKELYVSTCLFAGIFFIFSFLYHNAQLSFYNNSGSVADINVKGIITDKNIIHSTHRRSRQRTFFITVTDLNLRKNYRFTVSDFVFKRSQLLDPFNKVFSIGRLGVPYRKEEE